MNFIAIDFETANPQKDSAISIGLVKFVDGKKADSFYSLIKPQAELPKDYILEDFTDIHGLTYDDVKDAPLFNELWNSALKNWLDGTLPLVAHHAGFDMEVLNALFKKYSIPHAPLEYFDSFLIAKKVWSEFPNHRLATLGEKLGIVYNAHNALEDAETCGKVILRSANKIGCVTVKELLANCGQKMEVL